MTPATIYVPLSAGHIIQYADQCLTYAAARGYTFAGLVTNSWREAVETVWGTRGVLLYARQEHLDPNRLPRLELATPDVDGTVPFLRGAVPQQRRPRLL